MYCLANLQFLQVYVWIHLRPIQVAQQWLVARNSMEIKKCMKMSFSALCMSAYISTILSRSSRLGSMGMSVISDGWSGR